ncbi:pentapeptide repeat-containing protein [Sesbania bispinosa]|nr:pentapeptide repeat-containing protein [Sesbania bispinosa]
MDVEIIGENKLRFRDLEESGGDVNLQESLDKHLQVVLQPKHVVEEKKLDPIDDSDAEMSGQDESSSEESEADEVAMAEEDNEVHDQ